MARAKACKAAGRKAEAVAILAAALDLDAGTLTALPDRTESLLGAVQSGAHPPQVDAGAMVGLLFLENSTRTRCSFEAAVHRLGLSTEGDKVLLGGTTIRVMRRDNWKRLQRLLHQLSFFLSGTAAFFV